VTVDHEVGDSSQRCGRRVFRPICIEDGVWIGSRAVILPGVRIGRGAVVGAGAVVTRDVPAHALVAGIPAKTIRDLNDEAFDQVRRARPSAGTQPPAA
jgi:acetyltransferase-like isoleucine patch superfamily enzyme